MNFFHCPIRIISRNKGRSAVAASAYISATRQESTWDGTTHDYTRKRHVVYAEVMLPEHAPPEYADRNVLWNSVEWSETKRDADGKHMGRHHTRLHPEASRGLFRSHAARTRAARIR